MRLLKQHKNYQDEDKTSAMNKKINSLIKKLHLKMIPIKDNKELVLLYKYLNNLIVCKQMSSGWFRNINNKIFA